MPLIDNNRVVWITGAGKGIGRALAKRMANEGWAVAASARTEQDLASLKSECPSGGIHCFPLDVTDPVATSSIVERIVNEIGSINLVVLNAGNHIPMTAKTFSSETFRTLIDTNLMGVVYGLEQVIPMFSERHYGHIAVVASLAGYRGLPTSSAYGASKAALINMCESLKPELDLVGVKLTLINPGFVETPLTDKNKFPMPFLIPVEDAVDVIIKGLKTSAFEISFPLRFVLLMKVLRVLPHRIYFALTKRMV
jgi:NADP-dependent 3-hydroxy acid dehydrogenase YdfG